MPDGEERSREDDHLACGDFSEEKSVSIVTPNTEKDPRKIARKYQLDLCKKALEENVIVYLGTGCGKTHIAVLLIYELGHLIRAPQKSVCIFLAPTVALVHQQAKVIEDSIDFKVGIHCGNAKHLKCHRDWEKEIEEKEVLVMTPQILLHNLSHSFIKMKFISLLIFDECHHAQVKSSHPYAQIMKVFYNSNDGKSPRIFGMTASPVVGKGASSKQNLPKYINSLESILNAKVYTVEGKGELELFVATPVIRVYPYDSVANGTISPFTEYESKLEDIKCQCMSELSKKDNDPQSIQSLQSTKKMLKKLHENLIFCMQNLGLLGALQGCKILSGDRGDWNTLIEAEGSGSEELLSDRYLAQAANLFAPNCLRDECDLSAMKVLKEPLFSRKLLRLIGILSSFRLQPNMKCIVFVNRIVIARSLTFILQSLKFLTSWKCNFLVGVNSGLRSMPRQAMNNILKKFRTGELNLLVATKVGEEGLDIQTCCLVIRFDLPETVASFIQSRGRARMPQSEYAFLVDRANQREIELIENFKSDEERMNMEIDVRTSNEAFVSPEEKVYKVDSSGAIISSDYSVSLLHRYCSKLPHDEYFDPKPDFFYFDDLGGIVCNIILPSNAPFHQIVGSPQSSMENAKKDTSLKAIEQLHKMGALNNFLLPHQEDMDENSVVVVTSDSDSDSDSDEDESSRRQLHEMLVPAVLKESWSSSELILLNCYYIEFCPVPEDRIYRKFGLFIKEPLPQEAERMEVVLHLAHNRLVETKLSPSGSVMFRNDEILQAQNFQEMFLKAILERSLFRQDFVSLGTNAQSTTFYLLLPINFHGRISVDWVTIRRCLQSPIFRSPADCIDEEGPPHICLQLANCSRNINDIKNSLVYVPHKEKFYFITNMLPEKNGYSPHKGSDGPTHVEHLYSRFRITLNYPKQPLLCAKPLFFLHNLLLNRRKEDSESQELDEYFDDFPPELCELKIIGFSKDMGSSISLLPSIMHRLENLLVAIELKEMFRASFSEGAEVTAHRVLEAITTEKCQERFSLERLEILGDSFLKFVVARHFFLLHASLDEGELTRKRSNAVNNSNLFKLASTKNLQAFVRDKPLDPQQFFALGHPCPLICNEESEQSIHCQHGSRTDIRCSRGHHWLFKKTIADVVEALVGAFMVDSGFKAAVAFLRWIGLKVDFDASHVVDICLASSRYMSLASSVDLAAIENLLGYQFLHRGLLLQAFVHPSYNEHGGGCYQRLEFLGDAVLDYFITSYLFSVYPKLKPGHLTDLRSALVNNRAFAGVAIDKSFHKFLICNSSSLSEAIKNYELFVKNPTSKGGLLDGPKCPKALGDLVESCFGAILLDSGFDMNRVWKIMLSLLDPILTFTTVQLSVYRELQELCQSRNWDLQFPWQRKGRIFVVEAKLNYNDVCLASVSASNASKKEAIKIASEQIFTELKDQGVIPKSNYLEDILRSTQKMEAKLIGCDETPIDIPVLIDSGPNDMDIDNSLDKKSIQESCSVSKITAGIKRLASPSNKSVGKRIQTTGGPSQGSSRSRLYEICAANCWKSPIFEPCNEEGPCHLKSFVYKVIVKIEEESERILECHGGARTTKKLAAEHAADGAIWYLKSEGYL